jgi:hypothetical protein
MRYGASVNQDLQFNCVPRGALTIRGSIIYKASMKR